MKTPLLSDVVGIISKLAPAKYAEAWDNTGLQVGDPSASVNRIMISLDAAESPVDAAIASHCDLLLTHHPLIFKPIKKITRKDSEGSIIYKAITGKLSIVSLHTNYDIAEGGVNDLLADLLGLQSCEPLQVSGSEELLKVAVYVPSDYEESVRSALIGFSLAIGNYDECSFGVSGTGTFRPLVGSSPFVGETGKRSSISETRIEVLIRKDEVNAAIAAMKKAHPYEEPAYDCYQLHNRGAMRGLGRIGELAESTTVVEYAQLIKSRLAIETLRCVGDISAKVKRVAVCGGSGASCLREASFKGADLLVTGDLKYHDARDAENIGMPLIDAGHFSTEKIMVEGLAKTLKRELLIRGFAAEVLLCAIEKDPFIFL